MSENEKWLQWVADMFDRACHFDGNTSELWGVQPESIEQEADR